MTDHCFISYSTADALEFATKLANELEGGYPHINVWFDKRDLRPGMEWDIQIDEGLKSCKLVLFVMTKDSTNEKSVCKQEWSRALSYKKLVIPLLLQPNIHTPFRLGDRQRIDFTDNFEAGVAQLRRHLAWLDSPAGELQAYKDRLADAERDLRRASDEEKLRIKAEIEDLTKQIEVQQKIVADPEAAKKHTEENIQSGLERERQPEKPVAGKTSTRFINPPPGISPNYFQDRFFETEQIAKFLNNDSQRLMTVVGRAGVGKTAMVCRLLKALERGELPDDLGEMKVDGIVYLSETGSHRVNFANVFANLSKLLPPSGDTAERLEGIYKNPQTSTGDKMRALLDAFPSGRVILLLDNFETLIDPESLGLRDSELSEALNALLGGQHHAVKAVITTRIAPRELAVSEPGRQHHLSLDEGLESPYAENVLREMDADGRVGLKSAPDALLNKAREKTRGYPRALEALYAILSVDRYTTLEELLEISLPDEVVQKLVGEAFNRLDPSAQKVMQALAVYNRPVSPAAIDYLLQPHLPSIDSALVLNRLVNMHFARREAGKYYLHPADKEYAFSIIPEKDLTTKDTKVTKENQEDGLAVPPLDLPPLPTSFESLRSLRASRLTNAFTQHDLLNRAADYFAQARKPRAEWKKLDDLTAQLAEFDLRCEAGDYDTAASVLTEIDFNFILLWGHYLLALKLYEKVQKHLIDKRLRQAIIGNTGITLYYMGHYQQAIIYISEALKISEAEQNKNDQMVWINWLANSYSNVGRIYDANIMYEKFLIFAEQIDNKKNTGYALGNLGNNYASLGNIEKAIEYYKRSLILTRETGNERDEGVDLGNLGNRYFELGETYKSLELYEEALGIDRTTGYRQGESVHLMNIGFVYTSLEKYETAERYLDQALQIAHDISFIPTQQGVYEELATVYLAQNDLIKAHYYIEKAHQFDVPLNNYNTDNLSGIIALRQGERETAQEAFAKSIAQADEILAKTPDYYEALDAKGLALCGLAIADGGPLRETEDGGKYVADALEVFRKARKIAPHAGVVKSVLRLFDELAKCDNEGILKDVRDAAEGKIA